MMCDKTDSKPFALIGGGGHARSVMAMLGNRGSGLVGYTSLSDQAIDGVDFLGDDDTFKRAYSPSDVDIHIAFVAPRSGDMSVRRRIIESYDTYRATTLIADSAVVAPGSKVGAGCALMHRVVINAARLGKHVVVNTGAIVEHQCVIGDNVFIGPGSVVCGAVTIGEDCFIGAGAVIAPGVTLTPGTVVGMNTTVLHDITDGGTWIGTPARKIKD